MDWNLNNNMVILLLVTCSALLSAAYVFLWSQQALGDEANERSLHQGKQLTAGGVFILLPWLLYATWHEPLLWPIYGVWLMMLVGLADDVWHWNAKPKLLTQCIATAVLLYYFNYLTPSWWLLFLFFAILWWLNLFNFMDGSNGIAGLHAAVVLVFYLFLLGTQNSDVSLMIQVLLGSITVFLVFNLILGRLFMGDTGSLPLAYVLAWLALLVLSQSLLTLPLLLLLHASFVTDASFTLVYRLKNKERLSQAHNTHFYQRWVKAGASHSQVALTYALTTAVCAVFCYYLRFSSLTVQWSSVLSIYLVMAVFFLKTLRLSR